MADKNDRSGASSKERTFGPDRKLEDSAGAKGEDRKRAVDANRTGERSETAPKPESKGSR
jgi:hypothetical protein